MYKASKLDQYSIIDNLKKIAFIPSFPCEKFFSEKKSFERKVTVNKKFFFLGLKIGQTSFSEKDFSRYQQKRKPIYKGTIKQ